MREFKGNEQARYQASEPYPEHLLGAESGDGQTKLKRLLLRLLVRWHWILLGLLLGVGVGIYQAWCSVPQYRSLATLLVFDDRNNIIGREEIGEFDLRNSQSLETVKEGLSTVEVCYAVAGDAAVRKLKDLMPPPKKDLFSLFQSEAPPEQEAEPSVSELGEMIKDRLSVNLRQGTRLIDVEVVHPQPVVAQTICDRLIHNYIEIRKKRLNNNRTMGTQQLRSDVEQVRKELQEAEGVLARYATSLEAERRLSTAEAQLDKLALRYRSKHPSMIEAQSNLTQARENFSKLLWKVVRDEFDKVYWNSHLLDLEGSNQLDMFDKVRDLLISRLAVLESEIESQKNVFDKLNGRLGTEILAAGKSEAEVETVEPASLSNQPYTEGEEVIILEASLIGLLAGCGLAFFFHLIDNKFRNLEQVEIETGLPILASVERLENERIQGEASLEPDTMKWDLIGVERNQDRPPRDSESFRVLRASISLLGPSEMRKLTLISSSIPNEGKTLIAANLAIAFAEQGLKTLMVDTDLRKPSIHRLFGKRVDDSPGLADLLVGNADLDQVCQSSDQHPNLTLLLAGTKAPSPGALFLHDQLEHVFRQLKNQFDQIIVDSAPLLPVPDTRILAPLVDNFCFVVRADSTPIKAVKRALDLLNKGGRAPSGIVLNDYNPKRLFSSDSYGYGYSKYGYHGYGSDEND